MQSLSICILLESLSNSLKWKSLNAMFTLTVFEILLFEGRSVLSPALWGTGSERISCSVKIVWIAWKVIDVQKLKSFLMVFIFLLLFNTFSAGKIEKLGFWDSNNSKLEILITREPQVQNLSNLISLKNFSKTFCKRNFYSYVFEILLFEGRSVLSPARRGLGAKGLTTAS